VDKQRSLTLSISLNGSYLGVIENCTEERFATRVGVNLSESIMGSSMYATEKWRSPQDNLKYLKDVSLLCVLVLTAGSDNSLLT